MTYRSLTVIAMSACIALVLAQYVVPAWPGFHTWQYAATLCLGAFSLWRVGLTARPTVNPGTSRLAFPTLGALVVVGAGLASGLLGPDTETVERAPGTVAPLPGLAAAAFFPIADAAAIARGDARVVLRRRNGSMLEIGPGQRRYVGTSALTTQAHVVAYVEARDSRNQRLTVTQPTNAAFLSPVLFFGTRVTIARRILPADSFAVPALHRQIKAFFFDKDVAGRDPGLQPGVLFAADDDAGHLLPGALGLARSGGEVTVAGVRLRPTVGSYPVLLLSAVPAPLAVGLGAAIALGGLGYAFFRPNARSEGRRTE